MIGALSSSMLGAGGFLQTLMGDPEFKIDPEIDPKNYRDQLVMGDDEMRRIRQYSKMNMLDAIAPNLRSIERVGAARNAPTGSILTSLQGVNQNVLRKLLGLEPKLAEQKRASLANYLRLSQPLHLTKAQLDYQNQMQQREDVGSSLGLITKLLMQSGG